MIHNISIATDDDIIQFGGDVNMNIYPVYLSRLIIIWGNCLNLLEKDHCFRPYFFSISCKLIWKLTYGHWVYVFEQLCLQICLIFGIDSIQNLFQIIEFFKQSKFFF